jgi:hypothetical protein
MAQTPRRGPAPGLNSVAFNQDASCLVVGLDTGFLAFTTEPFAESVRSSAPRRAPRPAPASSPPRRPPPPPRPQLRRDFGAAGGVGPAALLYRTNISALAGGGPRPRWPEGKAVVWDDASGRPIAELPLRAPVRALALRRDRLAAALDGRVLVYTLEDLRLVHSVETAPNPRGLLALAPGGGAGGVLACPGPAPGEARVEVLATRRARIVRASRRRRPLAALALSDDGALLATASEQGTVIKVFSSADGAPLRELRRGADPARVWSLAFSGGAAPAWLAASSDKGTAHAWALAGRAGAAAAAARAADGEEEEGEGGGAAPAAGALARALAGAAASARALAARAGGGRLLAQERSHAQRRLPDAHRAAVAFSRAGDTDASGADAARPTLFVASTTGAFHALAFDPARPGLMELVADALFAG